MSATCLNRSNKEIDKIAKEFGEVKTSELLNQNFKKIPTYQEFINNPVVKQELGIVPISKVKDAIGRQFPKEINSNQLIDLKKLISSTNNKLKGIVYMLYNVSRIGQSDLHTWGLRKVEGDLDFEAKLQRALRTNTNTVEAQTKITELKRRAGEQQTLFQAESQSAIPSSIIKPGVQELFESNPELANAVYEALGFNPTMSKLTKEGQSLLNSTFNKVDNNKAIIYANYLADAENHLREILSTIAGLHIYQNLNSLERTKYNLKPVISKIIELKKSGKSAKLLNQEYIQALKEELSFYDGFLKDMLSLVYKAAKSEELFNRWYKIEESRIDEVNRLKNLIEDYKQNGEKKFSIMLSDNIEKELITEYKEKVSDERVSAPVKYLENKLKDLITQSQEFFIGELSKNNNPTERNIFNRFTNNFINSFIEEGKNSLTVAFLLDGKNEQSINAKIQNLVRELERRLDILKNKKNGHYLMTVLNLREYNKKNQNIKDQITLQQKQQAQQLYSQYLDTIFPDSKVKDIVYRGGNLGTKQPQDVEAFTTNKSYAEYRAEQNNTQVYTAILNIQESKLLDKKEIRTLSLDRDEFEYQGYGFTDNKDQTKQLGNFYTVKENNRHILGSKQDIEGFKKFVNQASFYQSTPQSTLPIDETVVYQFKVVNFITSNLPKINQWWKQLGNTDSFWNKVQQDLKIPKAQILLFRNAEGETVENKLASFAANYSYTIEINTAKDKRDPDHPLAKNSKAFFAEQSPFGWWNVVDSDYNIYRKEFKTKELAEQYANGLNNEGLPNTQHYSNLTVPGGTNYTENEIATPAIIPNIKGHAQFATDKGIGWFRSDEQVIGGEFKTNNNDPLRGWGTVEGETAFAKTEDGTLTKTRRILEVQSDLFQKGRDREKIVKETDVDYKQKKYFKTYSIKGLEAGYKISDKDNNEVFFTQSEEEADNKLAELNKEVNPFDKQNQFLQLLNKDNNWVTFFVKSIIQDSAKKGYEKVLFPRLDTIIQIESRGKWKTYEEAEKAMKDDRWQEIDQEYRQVLREQQEEYSKNPTEKLKQLIVESKERIASHQPSLLNTAKFYENDITNILNKQYGKENVKQVTDEYGNTWNEVKVQIERDLAPILFQSTSQSTRPVDTLANKMRELLQKLGFTVEEVDRLLAPDGTNVIAEVNLLDAIIRIAKGKADITTLPEEAATVVVEMVKGPLKDKMMRDITKFKIYDEVYATYSKFPNYQNEDGSVNEDKIKLEAISKLITRHLVNDYVGDENATNITGAMKWFQLVLNRIRSLFSKLSFDEYNAEIAKPFRDIANAMLSGDISSLESSAITSAGTFYQAQPQAKVEFTLAGFVDKIVEKSNSIIKPQNDVADSKYKYGNRQGVRITSVAKSRYKAIYGDQTTTREDAAAQFGTQAHEVQSFIIQKYFPEQNKHLVFTTNASSLEERSKFFSPFEEWVKSVKANGDILISEITVFGKAPVGKTYIDVGGTIDILRIRPDGTGDIYDLKTTKGMTKGKLKEWETQLGLYAHLLEQGDPKAGLPPIRIYEKRIIPLSTRTVTSGQTVKVVPVSFKDKLFLPLAAEESRKDEISAKIRKIRGVIELSERLLKGAKDAARERIKETIARNQALIENILLEAETEEVLTSLAYEVSLLEAQIEGGIDPKEYKVITSQLDAYESLAQDLRIKRDNAKAVATRKNILSDLTDIKQLLNDQEKKFITESVERLGFFGKFNLTKEGLFNNLKEIGFAAANVLGISSNPNAIAQSLYLTVSEAQDKAIAEYQDVVERLYNVMKKVADKRGATLDAFNPILEDDGKTLVRQVNSQFYKERAIALKKGGAELQNWLKENTEFDEARYLKSYEIMKKIKQNPNNIKALASDLIRRADLKNTELPQPTAEAQAKAILEKQLTEWVSKNRTLQMYNKPKLDKWTNPKYEALMKDKSLEDLKEYYMEYNKILDMLRDILPEHIQEGFIANFEAELLQKFRTHGVSALTDYAKETIQLRQNLEQKGVAGPTGELLRDIKIIGLEEIPGMEKSKDLTTSIAAFTFNALMYKHLSDVEHLALMTMNQVAGSKKYKVSLTGDIRLKNGQPDFIEGKGNLDNQIAAYIESVFYGIQKKDDYEKASSFLDKMIGYTTATNLILNPVAPIVDIIGNSSNALFTGAKNLYYGKKDIAWGLSMASSGDLGLTKDQRIAKALIKKFRVLNERYAKDEQDKLNIQLASLNFNKISAKALDSNTWYKPYQVSDYVIQNGVLLAMLKSGKYNYKLSDYDIDDNNNLVWIGTGTEPSNLEFTKFRQTVKSVNKNIAGNYDPYDAMMAKQYVAGRMLMQHRGWLPAQFLERWGNERPDYILGQMIEGRYRTLTKYVKNLIVEHNIAALKGEQLSESQRANMKANLAEMAVLVGIVLLLSLLKGDDDDVELRKRNAYAIRITTRWFNELVFFYDPTLDSIKAIIQSPVPSSSIMDKGTTLFNKIYDVTFGDEESLEGVTRSAARFIPAANGIWNGIDLIEGAVEGK